MNTGSHGATKTLALKSERGEAFAIMVEFASINSVTILVIALELDMKDKTATLVSSTFVDGKIIHSRL